MDENEAKLTLFECFKKQDPSCEHEWPSDSPKDDDVCKKCGMGFLAHIYMEMP